MRKTLKNTKGITLIALVVTIVVLLILAGVSINALFGDTGIINRAKDAQNKMDQAAQNDLDSLDELDGMLDSLVSGKVTAPKGSLLEMYRKAKADNCTNSDGSCTNEKHLHIGDYVDYKNPTSGTTSVTSAESGMYGKDTDENYTTEITQTYTLSASKNNVKWRVLGEDSKTGELKLIAADPIERDANADLLTRINASAENPYLFLMGAESYLYGPDAMNKVCAMYLNPEYAKTARSVTMDDVNEITGVTTADKIKEVNLDPVLNSSSGAKQYGEKYSYSDHYTPTLWLQNKKNNEDKTTTVSGTVDGYFYSINSKVNDSAPSVTVTNTRASDMMFKDVEWQTGKAYWLASRGVRAHSDYAFFGPGIVSTEDGVTYAGFGYTFFNSYGRAYSNGFAVRPVVVLKSDVMATAVPKIADQASTWTYSPNQGS